MTTTTYEQFLLNKTVRPLTFGKKFKASDIHPFLHPFQCDVALWGLRKGRCAVFLDTGLGKTFIQLEWSRLLAENTLIIAPLSVARQTCKEAQKIDVDVTYVREQQEKHGIWITNYELIDKFDFSSFGAVVLDESSLLKSLTGKTRRRLTKLCKDIPYRLCCTATPAPNDYTEIGNHAQFLGICTMGEMLAMFFINANKEYTYEYGGKLYRKKGSNKGGQEWRLKHHAEDPFYRWLSAWAITMILPSDLGYSNDGFVLPPLNIQSHFVRLKGYRPEGELFFTGLKGIKHRNEIRRASLPARFKKLKELIGKNENSQWIVWADLNEEGSLASTLPGAVEVKGSDPILHA